MTAAGTLPNGEPTKAWKLQPDGTWLSPSGWRMYPDGSVKAPEKNKPLPPGTPPVPSPQNSINVALAQRGSIIDRWNATYYYNQVSAQSRAFLVQNANAFNKWYKGANAQQAKMDADFQISPDQGVPQMTQSQQDTYRAPRVTPKTPKVQKMRSGMSGADMYAMRVARDLAKWK